MRLALGDSPDFEIDFHERFYVACAAHDGPLAGAIIREALAWTLERITRRLAAGTIPAPVAIAAPPPPSADPLHA